MRLIASFVFHLLSFLRVPLIIFLRIGSAAAFLAGVAVLVYIPLGYKESMLGGMAAFAFGSSFGFYLLSVVYDKILFTVSRARFASPQPMPQGVR